MIFFMAIEACLLWKYNFLNRRNNSALIMLITMSNRSSNLFSQEVCIPYMFSLCNIYVEKLRQNISGICDFFLLQVDNIYFYDLILSHLPPSRTYNSYIRF